MRKSILYGIVGILVFLVITQHTAWGYLSDLTGHWSSSLVRALGVKGIISGDEQGRFDPNAPLTRAQMAKLLTVAMGYESDAVMLSKYVSRYPDVPQWHWGNGFIEVAAELGVVDGYPDGQFRPDDPVTRAQLAMLVVRSAGLVDRARLTRLEPTPYQDDDAIPAWARGAVFVAHSEALMTGTPDGYFYPNQLVTRAEGATAIFRLLARNGSLFHLAGTLVDYDSELGSGTVRDTLGQERFFTMASDAIYLRRGNLATPEQIEVLDQVFIVLDSSGKGGLLEARYEDLHADLVVVKNGELILTLPSGQQEVRPVQPGALILLNGRKVPLEAISGTGPVYVAFDQTTGEVRLIDTVNAPIKGFFAEWLGSEAARIVSLDGQESEYALAPDLIVIIDYLRAEPNDLLPGDEVRLALDDEGRLVYIEVTR